MKRRNCLAILLCLAMLPAPYASALSPPDLSQLGWLQGQWQAQTGDSQIDESWSLQGNSLLGVSRSLQRGLSTEIELMVLEPWEQTYQMRLRFFSAAAEKALRGKDQPLRLELISADQQHFVCQGVGTEAGTSLSYRLIRPDMMEAELIKQRDGKIVHREHYQFFKRRID